jgi:serine/alanine adding enzyme
MDYKDKELVQYYFDQLKKLAKKDHCIFIKFDPAIHVNDYDSKSYNINRYKETELYLDTFKSCKAIHHGYTTSIADTVQPRFQSNVYSYENIDETLPKHTKRLIKDADRRNVQIIHGQGELLDEFSRLVELTESRKGVALRDKGYFKTLLENYKDGGVIFLAMCNVYQLNKEAKIKKGKLEKEIAQTCENAKKKLHRLEDQLRSVDKDIKEFKEIFSEFGQENKDIAIAGILSIQYGNTCEMLYAGMDERFKKFMP